MKRGKPNRSNALLWVQCFLPLLTFVPLSPRGEAVPAREDWYVSPEGNDAWSGTLAESNRGGTDGPFATLEEAKRAVRTRIAAGLTAPVRVLVRGGTYYLPDGFIIGPEDSGTAECSVTYAAYPGERVVLVGGMRIEKWRPANLKGLWEADVPPGVSPNQLFEDGRRMTPARIPPVGYFNVIAPVEGEERQAFYYDPDDLDPFPSDYSAGTVFIWPGHNWFSYVKPIADIDRANRKLTLGTSDGYPMRPGDRYFIQNTYSFVSYSAALGALGECFIDEKAQRVLFWNSDYDPLRINRFDKAFVMSTARHVVAIQGRGPDRLVRNVHIEGFQVSIANGDAVLITGGEDCSIRQCNIENAYRCGVALRGGVRDTLVESNRIAFHGWHGVTVEGSGLGGGLDSYGNTIANNHIQYCGRLVGHGYGVHIASSGHNQVIHNHIHHVPRYGVTIKGTCFKDEARMIRGATFAGRIAKALIHSRNNLIAYNHIHHVNLDSQDTGGIEAWGPGIGNVIDHNIIHDVGNPFFDLISGIYLDDGADYFTVTNNIIWGIHGTHGNQCVYTKGVGNIIQNNVFVVSPDRVRGIRSFEMANEMARAHHYNHNIFYFQGDERAVYQFDNWSDDRVASSDYNLFRMESGEPLIAGGPADASWEAWRSLMGGKFDEHSVVADPLFVDPKAHDYRLRPESPALALGIKSIDTDDIGLRADYPFDDEPALCSRLELVEPLKPRGRHTLGRVRLLVKNVGSVRATGSVMFDVWPTSRGYVASRRRPPSNVDYDLEGGEEETYEFEVGAREGGRKLIVFTRPSSQYLDPAYLPVKVRPYIQAPGLTGFGSLDEVQAKVGELDGYEARSVPYKLGDIRFAVAGEELALHAAVNDTKISRAANPWEASCVELFASPNGKADIRQVFLLPETAEESGVARQGLVEGTPVIEAAQVATERKENGYVLRALIPLEVLGLSEERDEFYFEASVISWPAGADKYERDTLFGGPSAYNDASGYARVRVGQK